MDTPTPLSSVPTNASLKGEPGSSSQFSSAEKGVLKTSVGDVVLSQSIEDGGNETQISLVGVVNINMAQEELPALVSPRTFIFLPPETVELEIQIAEMFQALEETPSSDSRSLQQKETSAQTPPAPSGKVSIFSLQAQGSSQTRSLPSSQESLSPQQPARAIQGLNTPFSPAARCTIRAVPLSIVPHRRANPTSSQSVSHHSSRTYQTGHSTGTAQLSSQEWEFSSQTVKTCSTGREKRDGQQERHSDQEQNSDHSYQEEDLSDDMQVSSSKRSSHPEDENIEEVFSVSHFAYHAAPHPSSNLDQESNQSTFQKRPPSPMSLFSSQNATEEAPKEARVENVFLRFMRLMARILGQAEAEAHELYLRVKERTDNVDALTLLLSKINNEKGAIDWNQDEEMRALVDQAKKLGVPIGDSYDWSEEGKKLLKENIQMRKENMEKITQLERTDMQRHLQEVSQCHQARSNVLKLLKELMDTFIYNMRP